MCELARRAASLSTSRLTFFAVLFLAAVALLDFSTGLGWHFYAFYFPAIAIASWSGKREVAVGITLLGTLVLLSERVLFQPGVHSLALVWSVLVDGVALSFIASMSLTARRFFDSEQAKKELLRESNESLARNSSELASIMNAVPAAIFVAEDAGCQQISGNAVAHTLLGLPLTANLSASVPGGIRPRTYRVMRNGVEIPVALRPMQLAAAGQPQHDCQFDLVYDDGVSKSLRGDAVTVADRDGAPCGAVGVFLDVTDRERLESELEENIALVRAALASATDGICIFDSEGRITQISDSFRGFMRLKPGEPAARTLAEYLQHTELYTAEGEYIRPDLGVLPRVLRGESEANAQYMLRRKDTGESWWASFSFIPIRMRDGVITGGMLVARDTTALWHLEREKRKLERRVLNAEKMESLGILAGGIAHTFNNQLQIITAAFELTCTTLPEDSRVRSLLETGRAATDSAVSVARHMLDYSGRGHFKRGLVHLESIVAATLPKFKGTIDGNVHVVESFAHHLPLAPLDADQISRLVLNILTNAWEAIGERGGLIRVTTGSRYCDEAYLEDLQRESHQYVARPLASGEYVYVEISDTGPGMDEITKNKMFDPFFSTKLVGRGLGLATVLGIVRGHHGVVDVQSEPGKGTTLCVLFPTAETAVASDEIQACTPST